MNGRQPGKLKYINGIPYLTGRHVQLEQTRPAWPDRVLGAWQDTFGRRVGVVLLILLLVGLVAVLGALIDYALIPLLFPAAPSVAAGPV